MVEINEQMNEGSLKENGESLMEATLCRRQSRSLINVGWFTAFPKYIPEFPSYWCSLIGKAPPSTNTA